MVYSPGWGSRYATVGFKYLSQTFKTLWLLVRKRPRVVFVMAPPVVACLPVWVYCLLFRAKFVIDAHTGAFDHPRWRRLQFVQRFFSRRAATTIVTSEHYRQLIERWGAAATIVTDVPVYFAEPAEVILSEGPNLVLVASFCDDEPIEEFLRAAAECPNVYFHVTGNANKLAPQLRQSAARNVRFTGFLSDGEYVGLICAADGVMALTSRDHTMQRAAYEAVYLGRPVITSDFGLLRKSFEGGAVFVDPNASAIRAGVTEFLKDLPRLRQSVLDLRERKLSQWDATAESLRRRFNLGRSSVDSEDLPTAAIGSAAYEVQHQI